MALSLARFLNRTARRARSGSALLEFAFVSPVVVAIGCGMFEGHSRTMAAETVSRTALQTADLVAREPSLTTASLNDIRLVVTRSLNLPPTLASRLTIDVASIGFDSGTGTPSIRWRNSSGLSLTIAATEGAGLGAAGDSVIVVAVAYDYRSPFSMVLPGSSLMTEKAFARPRLTKRIAFNGTS
jgi:Flp pilus assembly protein TadG